jgi:hypothetical protein
MKTLFSIVCMRIIEAVPSSKKSMTLLWVEEQPDTTNLTYVPKNL